MYSYGPPCLWRAIYFEIEGNGRRFTPGGVSATLLVLDHPRLLPQQVPAAATLKFQTNTKMGESTRTCIAPFSGATPGNKESGKRDARALRRRTHDDLLHLAREALIFRCQLR